MLRPADNVLIRGLAEGREEAFAALYDDFAPTLFRVAASLLGSSHDAEDAVQEVFVGVVRARARLPKVEDLRAYLFAALRRAAMRLASARRERSLSPEELLSLSVHQIKDADIDEALRLERALRKLPLEQREIVALKVDGGLTFAEIATVLAISPNTAASRYRYALEKLRAALES
jgi:RNA polymerase sigma-70 factor (ECF subfamily)